jgi:hypothetical protein
VLLIVYKEVIEVVGELERVLIDILKYSCGCMARGVA